MKINTKINDDEKFINRCKKYLMNALVVFVGLVLPALIITYITIFIISPNLDFLPLELNLSGFVINIQNSPTGFWDIFWRLLAIEFLLFFVFLTNMNLAIELSKKETEDEVVHVINVATASKSSRQMREDTITGFEPTSSKNRS
jgi:hypothetical protein